MRLWSIAVTTLLVSVSAFVSKSSAQTWDVQPLGIDWGMKRADVERLLGIEAEWFGNGRTPYVEESNGPVVFYSNRYKGQVRLFGWPARIEMHYVKDGPFAPERLRAVAFVMAANDASSGASINGCKGFEDNITNLLSVRPDDEIQFRVFDPDPPKFWTLRRTLVSAIRPVATSFKEPHACTIAFEQNLNSSIMH